MKNLIRRIIKEEVSNRRQEKLIGLIKSVGVEKTSKAVGGLDNLLKILDINSPMDFLNLFNDLDVVQSEENSDFVLFRYKPKDNLMVYDMETDYVDINYTEIWSVLEVKFGLKYSEIGRLIQEWLSEVYNLRGVTTSFHFSVATMALV